MLNAWPTRCFTKCGDRRQVTSVFALGVSQLSPLDHGACPHTELPRLLALRGSLAPSHAGPLHISCKLPSAPALSLATRTEVRNNVQVALEQCRGERR